MQTSKTDIPPGVNSVTCWVVRAPFTIRMTDGTEHKIASGFAMQTPKFYDNNEVKINGVVYKGEDVLELVDGNGNVFW